MASLPRVLIYGVKGALGSTCITYFKAKNWVMFCVEAAVLVWQGLTARWGRKIYLEQTQTLMELNMGLLCMSD